MEYNDYFRNELLSQMSNHLDASTLKILDSTVIHLLDGYTIESVKNELMVVGGYNDIVKNQFLNIQRLSGLSDSTIEQYGRAIDHLFLYLNKDVRKITANDIRRFLDVYKSINNITDITLENKRRFLSTFFSWLMSEEYISKNPMDRVKSIKVEKKVKKAFSGNEMTLLRESCVDLRERALIEFFYGTGCRVSEVVNMVVGDLDFENEECLVTKGKGNKQRMVFPSDASLQCIKEYLDSRDDVTPGSPLFTNAYGKPMTSRTIENTMHRIADRAGVDNCHPHKFRRTYITNELSCGASIQSVSRVAGHSNISTTMIYCAADNSVVKADVRRSI